MNPRPAPRLFGAVLIGAVFGGLASLSNQLETPLTFILNAGWTWAAIPVLAGWIVRRRALGALTGILAAAAAVLVYYACDSLLRAEPFSQYGRELAYWAIAVLIVGPILGLIGTLIPRPGVIGLLAGLLIPAGAIIEMILLPRWPDGEPGVNLQAARILTSLAAAGAVAALVIRARQRSAPPPVTDQYEDP